MRRTKLGELSSRKVRRLAQLSSSEWGWIVQYVLSVCFRRIGRLNIVCETKRRSSHATKLKLGRSELEFVWYHGKFDVWPLPKIIPSPYYPCISFFPLPPPPTSKRETPDRRLQTKEIMDQYTYLGD